MMPTGATVRVYREGRTMSRRSWAMTDEQRKLFRLRGGGQRVPAISQGGWNGTNVSASAGTHGQDAKDEGLATFTVARGLLWERCGYEVGYAGWIRPAKAGVWGKHWHALPKGGQLAPSADRQITQWFQSDDALMSDRDYPRIRNSGLMHRTWESYNDRWDWGVVNIEFLQRAFRDETPIPNSNDVKQVQSRLNHYTGSNLTLDGVPGPATRFVYETLQCRLFGVKRDHVWADKIPGVSSLEGLRLQDPEG